MNGIKRPYEIIIKLGGDDISSIKSGLKQIINSIEENEYHKTLQNPHVSISGSPDVGWLFSLIKTETKDHDDYFRKIEESLGN